MLRMHSWSYLYESRSRTFVRNYSNVAHRRVGQVVDGQEFRGRSARIYRLGDVLRKLRADPFKEYTVWNGRLAEAAGDIFVREFAEFEWKTTYGRSSGKPENVH